MVVKIKRLLKSFMAEDDVKFDHTLAIVCLLCEVCVADHSHSCDEEMAVLHILEKLITIDQEKAAELLSVGMKEVKSSNSVFDFTSQLSHLDHDMRFA